MNLILFVVVMSFVFMYRPTKVLEHYAKTASGETRFEPMAYEIYDKSSDTNCDRLIIVQPFGWIIWAILGQVYVLNDNNMECPPHSTSVSIVPQTASGEFGATCLFYNAIDIVQLYANTPMTRVPFTVEGNRFTILDALNNLFKFALTMHGPVQKLLKKRRKRSVIDHQIVQPQRQMQSFISNREMQTLYNIASMYF